ncbi:MAG TPA: PAS domain S-box protein [Phycisphaerae bacterium]|nr:PAS domain S-box protein [Phycisphaerae bacterium]
MRANHGNPSEPRDALSAPLASDGARTWWTMVVGAAIAFVIELGLAATYASFGPAKRSIYTAIFDVVPVIALVTPFLAWWTFHRHRSGPNSSMRRTDRWQVGLTVIVAGVMAALLKLGLIATLDSGATNWSAQQKSVIQALVFGFAISPMTIMIVMARHHLATWGRYSMAVSVENSPGSPSLVGRTRRLLNVALVTTAIVVLGELVYVYVASVSSGTDAVSVDLVGRQRMLGERIALDAMLIADDKQDQAARVDLNHSIARIQHVNSALSLGGEAIGARVGLTPDRRKTFANSSVRLSRLIAAALHLGGGYDLGEAERNQVIAQLTREKLAWGLAMDQLGADLSGEIEAERQRLAQLAIIAAGAFVIILLTKWMVIYRPILRRLELSVNAEVDSRREAERFQVVAERTTNAVILADADQRIRWVNAGFTAITGYEPEEVLTKRVSDVVCSDEVDDDVIASVRAALSAGEGLRFAARNRRRSGEVAWLDVDLQTLRDRSGAISGYVAIESDVTEQVALTERLYEQVHMLEEAERITRIGHWSWDAESDQMTWSRQIYEHYGRDPVLGPPKLADYPLLLTPESADELKRHVEHTLATGESFCIRMKTASANARWTEARGQARRNDDGRIVGLFGTCRDITEQVETQADLAEKVVRLESAERIASLGHWSWDAQTGEMTWSPMNYEHYDRDPSLGPPSFDEYLAMLAPDSATKLRRAFGRTMETGGRFVVDIASDGESPTWVESRGFPQYDDAGVVVGVFGTSRDITESVRAKQALDEKVTLLEEAERIAQIGHWSYDPRTCQITWSKQVYRLYRRDPAMGPPTRDEHRRMITPETGELLNGAIDLMMSGKELPPTRVQTVGAPQKWLEILGRPTFDDNGEVVRICGTVRDITDQVRTQSVLDEKVSRLEAAEVSANMGHFTFDLRTLRAQWSAHMFRLMNRDPALGAASFEDMDQILTPDTAAMLRNEIHSVMTGGVVRPLRIEVRSESEPRWLEIRAEATRTRSGDVRAIHGCCRDISPQVEREAQLTSLIEELRVRKLALDQYAIVTETDVSGSITKVNDNFCKISGYTRKELIGRNHRIVNSGHHPRGFWVDMYQKLAKYGVWRGEICNRAKDGSIYWVDTINMALKDATGGISKYVSVRFDATPRKRAEEQVRRSERELREMNDALPLMVWTIGPDGDCTFLNKCWTDFTGRELIRELGDGWTQNIHPDDLQRTLERYREALGNWEPMELQYRLRRHDGEYRWILDRGTPRFAEDGSFKGYVGGCIDITDQKAATDQVERSEAQLREMSDALPLLVWMADADRRVAFVNKRADDFPSRVVGARLDIEWVSDVHIDDVDRCIKAYEDAYDARAPFEIEYRVKDRDGVYRWILGRGDPRIADDGKLLGYVGGCIDVSARKKAEEALVRAREDAESADRSKSEFLANMSHEIRTPMTAILGYTELLTDTNDRIVTPQDRAQYVDTIRRNGEHLLTIINDILDLSKIRAGKMTVEIMPVNIARVVHDVVSLMNVRAAAKDIALNVSCASPIPSTIDCDPVRLRQILMNLVGNAVKFTEVGGVEIVVSFEREGALGPTLTIAVSDTGVGMTGEQMKKLFAAFQQADTSMTRRFGGTGLGLMISIRLAELLGGDLMAESEFGKGSVFTLALPVARSDAPMTSPAEFSGVVVEGETAKQSQATTSAKEDAGEKPLEGLRVLLVEDGPDNQRLIAFHVRKAGASVTLADNGSIAVESMTVGSTLMGPLMDPVPFDVILMDMQMPVMDGYEATRRLRSLGCRTPIIALTAHAMEGDRDKCIEAGCDDYQTKPIDRKRLVEACLHAVAHVKDA